MILKSPETFSNCILPSIEEHVLIPFSIIFSEIFNSLEIAAARIIFSRLKPPIRDDSILIFLLDIDGYKSDKSQIGSEFDSISLILLLFFFSSNGYLKKNSGDQQE